MTRKPSKLIVGDHHVVSYGAAENPASAVVHIKHPGKMSARERRDIVKWLRDQAAHLSRYGKDYTDGTFTGRFIRR